ncbi:MAG: flagellar hook-length control protein FliK [Hyphomicrobiaceae bacterium]
MTETGTINANICGPTCAEPPRRKDHRSAPDPSGFADLISEANARETSGAAQAEPTANETPTALQQVERVDPVAAPSWPPSAPRAELLAYHVAMATRSAADVGRDDTASVHPTPVGRAVPLPNLQGVSATPMIGLPVPGEVDFGVQRPTEPSRDATAPPPALVAVAVLSQETHLAPVRSFNALFAARELARNVSPPSSHSPPSTTDTTTSTPNAGDSEDAALTTAPSSRRHLVKATVETWPNAARSDERATIMAAERQLLPVQDTTLPSAGPAIGSASAQIVDGIITQVQAGDDAGATRHSPNLPHLDTPQVPFQRLLKLQLTPGSLGTVTIVLAGNEASLRIRLEAERTTTAASLERDRGAIEQKLSTVGYVVEALDIRQLESGKAAPDQQQTGSRSQDAATAMGSGSMHRESRQQGERTLRQPSEGDRVSSALAVDPLTRTSPSPPGERFLGRRAIGAM